MSKLDDAKKVLDVAGHGLRALETIGEIAEVALKKGIDPAAFSVLHTITEIVGVVRASLDGKVSIDHVEDEIKRLSASLADNDAAARSEADAKFPTEG